MRVRIAARTQPHPSEEQFAPIVDVVITEIDPPHRAFYRATVQLAAQVPEPSPYAIPVYSGVRPFPMSAHDAYRQMLFHGPRFQCIGEIEGMHDEGIMASIIPSAPQHLLANASADQWLIDPVVIDSGPQLAILWSRVHADMTALPSSFRSYHRYGPPSDSPLRCYFQVLPDSDDHTLRANVSYLDSEGRLLGLLEGLECTRSPLLNRLTEARANHAGIHS